MTKYYERTSWFDLLVYDEISWWSMILHPYENILAVPLKKNYEWIKRVVENFVYHAFCFDIVTKVDTYLFEYGLK